MASAIRLFVLLSIALFVISIVGVSQAGMDRRNPIDDMVVLQWNAGVPEGATYAWQGQVKLGAGGWTKAVVAGVTIQPKDCVAYLKGFTFSWRGCYVGTDGIVLTQENGSLACNEAETVEKMPEPCERIYDLGGKQFSADLVARWNADHVSAK